MKPKSKTNAEFQHLPLLAFSLELKDCYDRFYNDRKARTILNMKRGLIDPLTQEISSVMLDATNTSLMVKQPRLKTIGISQEAYDFLKGIGKKGDTFTDCVLSLRDAQK